MKVPRTFQENIVGAFGDAGKAWLERLDTIIKTYVERWQLQVEGPVDNLSYNYVLKANDADERPVILKLGLPGYDFTNEVNTVQVYGGRGCAKLLKADVAGGALLLERLRPGTMLLEIEDEALVLQHFINVWQATRCPVPAGLNCPTIMDWAKGIERYIESHPNDGPLPTEVVTKALDYFREITESNEGVELLHGDLHHQNILYSADDRGWLAIDPKGVAGDPYFGLMAFMVNEIHNRSNPQQRFVKRANALVDALDLDRIRFLKAGVAMTILFACWSIEDHDPDWVTAYECAQWFQQLMEE